MKNLLLVFVCLICTCLGAANLVTQYFTTSLPVDWYSDPAVTNWNYSSSANAGGTAGELRFDYIDPGSSGIKRYVSLAFDTRKVHNMTLSFRHMLDDFTTDVTYTIGAAISNNNGVSWTNVWSVTTTNNIAATQVTVSPISFTLGKSENTRICFFFDGNTFDLDHWYIDDIVLSYQNTLGDGAWSVGDYTPVGNVIIPYGYTMQLYGGTTLRFNTGCNLDVDGRLLVNGSLTNLVEFTSANGTHDWNGIDIVNNSSVDSTIINGAYVRLSQCTGINVYYSDRVRISNSYIYNNNDSGGGVIGGGIYLNNSDIVIDNCTIYFNSATLGGVAISSYSSNPVITYNKIYFNTSTGIISALKFSGGSVAGVKHNVISNNMLATGGYAVELANVSGDFTNNVIVNNDAHGLKVDLGTVRILHCTIAHNSGYGMWTNDILYNYSNIFWNNGSYEIYIVDFSPTTRNCCIQAYDIGGVGYYPSYYDDCITTNPLFVASTGGIGAAFYGWEADWRLAYNSPCIDTGYMIFSFDPDGSLPDMGAYTRHLKPYITMAADVPHDQGHQLDLRWNRSDEDAVYTPNDYYQIWWEDIGMRSSEDVFYVNQPSEVTPELAASGRTIAWRDGERTWCYVNQVPANNFEDYRYIVETLQDSSSTGTHQCRYMVIYDNNNYGAWPSVIAYGYTVDNIPPYAPSRLDISITETGTINLTWDEVTEGGWEGNSYPEVNTIIYKVYAGDTPDFEISPAAYLLSTTNPTAAIDDQMAEHKFYKITASDSE